MQINEQTPRQIVEELDKYVVGQEQAKRAVALALRNRWRSRQLDESMRDDVIPKNILMIGSTGVGKTEIARRLAKLVKAPFVKVEATKFTEVGYVGSHCPRFGGNGGAYGAQGAHGGSAGKGGTARGGADTGRVRARAEAVEESAGTAFRRGGQHGGRRCRRGERAEIQGGTRLVQETS